MPRFPVCQSCVAMAIAALSAFFTAEATAATFSIASDGSGDYPTIQLALDAASPGDVIELMPGTYRGPGNRALDFRGKGVFVQSATGDPASCVIDCQDLDLAATFLRGEWRDAGFRGITFTGGRSSQAGAIWINQSSPTIENCRFIENETDGVTGGAITWTVTQGVIRGCLFEGNRTTLGGGAMYSSRADGAEIADCVFRENEARSAPFGTGGAIMIQNEGPLIERCLFVGNDTDAGASALFCLGSAAPIIRSSTFVRNVGAFCVFSGADSSPVFENCIIAFNQGTAVECFSGFQFTCSDIYGNSEGDWTGCIADQVGVNGNLHEDPLFCDADSDDWTLRSDSPCAPSGDCGLIGALDVGCGPVPVISASWGGVKAAFSPSDMR